MKYTLLLVLCLFASNIRSAKILGILPFPSYSHFLQGHTILKELASKGHNVTVYSFYPQDEPIKNYKHVTLKFPELNNIDEKVGLIYETGQQHVLTQIIAISETSVDLTRQVLRNPSIKNLLKEHKDTYDLVVMEHARNDALMVIGHYFNCPLVLLTASPRNFYNNHLFGNPSPSSYVANNFADFNSKMTFWQRVKNTYYDVTSRLYYNLVLLPKFSEVLQETTPWAPDLEEILYKTPDLILVNSHLSIHDPVPSVPAMIDIGGHHIGTTKSLPRELQEFFQGATEGVVVVSFGSVFQVSMIPPEKLRVIVIVLSRIPYKVLWKANLEVPDLPGNIKIVKWMPQEDVLAQPQVKAFVTHGGLFSVTEAIHFAIPFVGLTFFWDQPYNVEHAVAKGLALKIAISQVTEENLSAALEDVIQNPKYKENMRRYSKILRDRPVAPMDLAVYWMEYVIRHQGAAHCRSAGIYLKWYERYLLDVAGLLLGIILFPIIFVWFLIKKLPKLVGINLKTNLNKKKV